MRQSIAVHENFDVSLRGESNEIRLIVRDWGIGFDPEEAVKEPGARPHPYAGAPEAS